MATISLSVNGERREVEADPAAPLIFVLRDQLGLTGPKLGCAQEQCGACAVIVDGERTLSCVRAASEFEDNEITTVEGLSGGGALSAIQQAFAEMGAAQCGYCTPGIVIATTALLRSNPSPSENEVIEALHQHLCRCGSHRRVLAAIDRLVNGKFAEGV